MKEDNSKSDREGGPYMIQDHDHMSEVGQMGGEAKSGSGRQSEQSQGGSHQQSSGQQGGQRGFRRPKLL